MNADSNDPAIPDEQDEFIATKQPVLLAGQDAMDVDEDIPDSALAGADSSSSILQQQQLAESSSKLIDRIITPAPVPTSSRFRNALARITTNPQSDVEAWQALMTEVTACYSSISAVHAVDADTQAKLDWVESCYGALLHNFPYAATYSHQMGELLLQQSARQGEEFGPVVTYGRDVSRRALRCERKLQALLENMLGVDLQGNPIQLQHHDHNGNSNTTSSNPEIPGMCSWSVDLWLLYIRQVTRDATRKTPTDEAAIRQATIKAYDTALTYAASAHQNHTLWKAYLAYVRSWTTSSGSSNADHALQQQQMLQLRDVYKRAVVHPMNGLDQLWQEYEAFERAQNETLAAALISELAPKYQHARSVYLERNRVYNADALQLDGRLARQPVSPTEEDAHTKMADEHQLLLLWKTRCSYERTNPERLIATDLTSRVRQIFQEMACAWTRHPECWDMWSKWELLVATTTTPTGTATAAAVTAGGSTTATRSAPDRALAVLQLAQHHIPDCTLLAFAHARIVEQYSPDPRQCLTVLDQFLKRSPNTLGFVLYQKSVRQYQGMEAARAVFGRARRTLVETTSSTSTKKSSSSGETGVEDETGLSKQEDGVDADKSGSAAAVAVTSAEDATATAAKDEKKDATRWIVTNRLDPSIGLLPTNHPHRRPNTGHNHTPKQPLSQHTSLATTATVTPPGPVTWHLYASHAMMEHRLNRLPVIAARVYELGLRKHASFLTKPPYVYRYAQLLLELGDTVNLRALLTRAVAACQQQHHGKELHSALAAMWDMNLYFESLMTSESSSLSVDGGAAAASTATLHAIETKRREALMGPDVEDVATGGLVGTSETALIGAQKSSIAEQLVRTEGYDVSSSIVNGMSRTVDMFAVMGLWGNDDINISRGHRSRGMRSEDEKFDDISGGKSDASYQSRLAFMDMLASGALTDSLTDGVGSKILSARERLQQGATSGAAGGGQSSAMMLAIQQSAEWLRPLLLLLPASRLRLPIVAKPPPHLTEMALNALVHNSLPVERPSDSQSTTGKRSLSGGNDSDDENGDKTGSGSYGSQFRARQRARQQNGMMDL